MIYESVLSFVQKQLKLQPLVGEIDWAHILRPMPVSESKTTSNAFEKLVQLVEQGFFIEVGHWPDTPVGEGDELLGMDARGQVLIARAPIKTER